MEIDLAYIDSVDEELGITYREALSFKNSVYGKKTAEALDNLETESEKSTVTLLVVGDIDGAKTSAALASGIQHLRGVLWQNAFDHAEITTSQKDIGDPYGD